MAHVKNRKKSAKAVQPPTKRVRGRKWIRFNVPLLEQHRIKKEFLESTGDDGTITAIARKFKRNRETVSAIIHAPDMKLYAEELGKKLLRTTADEVADRIAYEIKNRKSETGARIAMELAERWGAIPPKVSQIAARVALNGDSGVVQEEYHSLPQDERRNYWIKRLSEVTVERQELFGMPMPHLDAIREEDKVERNPQRLLTLSLKKEQAE
jgi:hypothetical protein